MPQNEHFQTINDVFDELSGRGDQIINRVLPLLETQPTCEFDDPSEDVTLLISKEYLQTAPHSVGRFVIAATMVHKTDMFEQGILQISASEDPRLGVPELNAITAFKSGGLLPGYSIRRQHPYSSNIYSFWESGITGAHSVTGVCPPTTNVHLNGRINLDELGGYTSEIVLIHAALSGAIREVATRVA